MLNMSIVQPDCAPIPMRRLNASVAYKVMLLIRQIAIKIVVFGTLIGGFLQADLLQLIAVKNVVFTILRYKS
jgi:hypothetical protein